jgi:hypothetical protein
MPRYTLFYDGDRPEQATAEDVASMMKTPGLQVLAQQHGLLLVSVEENIMSEMLSKFQGWVASREQCAVHPKPRRPALRAAPKK